MAALLNPSLRHTPNDLFALCEAGVGVSTGYMESQRGNWSSLVSTAGLISRQAVELSALSAEELPGLLRFLDRVRGLDFAYISVHGPAKGWQGTSFDLALELRNDIPEFVDAVVLHPENLAELEPFALLGDLLILENMDTFKESARTVEELAPFFVALPEAGFCFDIAHARMNDPSMKLAHALIDAFGDRLREVHLSSITNDGRHVPLAPADIEVFWPVLERCREVPWVLEAALPRDQNIA